MFLSFSMLSSLSLSNTSPYLLISLSSSQVFSKHFLCVSVLLSEIKDTYKRKEELALIAHGDWTELTEPSGGR